MKRLSIFSLIHPALAASLISEKPKALEKRAKLNLTKIIYKSSPLRGTEERDRKALGLPSQQESVKRKNVAISQHVTYAEPNSTSSDEKSVPVLQKGTQTEHNDIESFHNGAGMPTRLPKPPPFEALKANVSNGKPPETNRQTSQRHKISELSSKGASSSLKDLAGGESGRGTDESKLKNTLKGVAYESRRGINALRNWGQAGIEAATRYASNAFVHHNNALYTDEDVMFLSRAVLQDLLSKENGRVRYHLDNAAELEDGAVSFSNAPLLRHTEANETNGKSADLTSAATAEAIAISAAKILSTWDHPLPEASKTKLLRASQKRVEGLLASSQSIKD